MGSIDLGNWWQQLSVDWAGLGASPPGDPAPSGLDLDLPPDYGWPETFEEHLEETIENSLGEDEGEEDDGE